MRLSSLVFVLLLAGPLSACAAHEAPLGLLTPDWSRARSNAGEEPPAEATVPTEPAEALEQGVVASVRRRHQSSLGRCQKEVWSRMRFDVALRVAKEGAVTDVRVRGPSPDVAFCVERAVGAWRFPASEHRSFTQFALVFQPRAAR